MKKFITIAFLTILLTSTSCYATYVNGYTRSNGTYVQGHYRSSSDFTRLNNYSTRGNTNPYTGQKGYTKYNPYMPTRTIKPTKTQKILPY